MHYTVFPLKFLLFNTDLNIPTTNIIGQNEMVIPFIDGDPQANTMISQH